MGPARALRKYFAKRPQGYPSGPRLFLLGNARLYVSPESQPAPLSFEKGHALLGLGSRGSRPCDVGLSRVGWFTGACLATVSIAEAAAGAEGGGAAESERFGYAVEMS